MENRKIDKILGEQVSIRDLADWVKRELVKPENKILKERYKSVYRYENRFFYLVIRKLLTKSEVYYLKAIEKSHGFKFILRNMFFGDLYCMNYALYLILLHPEMVEDMDHIFSMEIEKFDKNLETIARQINKDQKDMMDVYVKDSYSVFSFFVPDPVNFDHPDVVDARKEYIFSRLRIYMRLFTNKRKNTHYHNTLVSSFSKEEYMRQRRLRENYLEKIFDISLDNISSSVKMKEGDRIEREMRLSKDITLKILRHKNYEQIAEKAARQL